MTTKWDEVSYELEIIFEYVYTLFRCVNNIVTQDELKTLDIETADIISKMIYEDNIVEV